MTTHAPLSPSARHRWSACPGSVRECAKYPDDSAGPAAIDGTHSHTLLERCLLDYRVPESYVGETLTDHDGSFVVDSARADRVKVATHYIEDRISINGGMVKLLAETRVDPAPVVGRSDMSGTVDVMLYGRGILEIIDYKDGMNPVSAEGNHQMEQYALGALCRPEMVNVNHVRMTIVQPKLALKGMEPISTCEVGVAYIKETVRDRLIAEGKAVDDPNAPLVPGESQCKYCKHKGACNALVTDMMAKSGVSFDIDIPSEVANKDPATMSNEQIREIVESAPLMRQMLEAVEAEAMRRMESGTSIEGLKIVRGRGSRSWLLDDNEIAEKLTKMGVPKGEVWETKLVSVSKIEKLKWTKRDGTQKQLSERQLKTIADEYVKKSDGKLTVASASDPRPEVILNAAPMFAPVESVATVDALPSWLS